jgi:hypothetical protein
VRKTAFLGLLAVALTAGAATVAQAALQERAQDPGDRQAISYDKWLATKESAERYDRDGKYVQALQYYLEYTRQAEGLGRPGLVAWGKNNAAFMIIKMHREDPTVDLAPAKRMLEEGLAIAGATEECKKLLAMNMDYIRLYFGRPN